MRTPVLGHIWHKCVVRERVSVVLEAKSESTLLSCSCMRANVCVRHTPRDHKKKIKASHLATRQFHFNNQRGVFVWPVRAIARYLVMRGGPVKWAFRPAKNTPPWKVETCMMSDREEHQSFTLKLISHYVDVRKHQSRTSQAGTLDLKVNLIK